MTIQLAALPHHRTVAEVMTRDVVTVTPDTGFKEIVRLLTGRNVSAVPVVDPDGRLAGIVSEHDLLAKERHLDPPVLAGLRKTWREEHGRAEAGVARELMTSPAIAVRGEASLRQAARLMHRRGLRRLCVVDDAAQVVGIVTRGDLLRAFIRPDEDIAHEVREGLARRTMWLDASALTVQVTEGVVRLSGQLERSSENEILEALVRGLDGVVGVENELTWRFDDRDPDDAEPPLF